MNLSLQKVFPFLIVVLLVTAGIFHFAVSKLGQSGLPFACSPVTTDGLVVPGQTVAFWQDQPVIPPLAFSTLSESQTRVLGATTSDKWIEIDLSDQTLTAHQGDQVFLSSPISSGLYHKTPVGEYHIWYKLTSTLMTGGIKGQPSYYYLPNVPFTMYFFGSYGIHGTYWHSNFGHPMSHGCVNTPTPVAEKLFYWADPQLAPGQKIAKATDTNPGTRVVVHE